MTVADPHFDLARVLPVLDEAANTPVPDLSAEAHREIFRAMLKIRMLDEKLLLLQRQGRIAFFGPAGGQEASIIGSGWVAREDDWVFPALRENGILFLRGFPLERWFGQLFGNELDTQKGRQQPMHFSSGEHHFVSLSSVIATQLPQAAGAAYAAKIRGDDCVVLGYIGDGGTSEHDFHCALNFAGVKKAPVVFVCQNNQWAISVPFEKQTASRGIAVKAKAYGMPGVRVDGNDVLAVLSATRQAHERARRGEGPTLIECVTYRRGGHSSSDDPTRYRDESKVAPWLLVDPIDRYRDWLTAEGLWTSANEDDTRAELRAEMDRALEVSEKAPRPPVTTLVEDVWAEVPPALREQERWIEGDGSGEAEGAFPL